MAPLPYTDHGAKVAFYVAMGVVGVLELRVRMRSGLNRQGSRVDRGSFALVYVTTAVGLIAAFALAGWHSAAIRTGRWPLFVAGVALIAVGTAIRQWAVALLGRFFTVDVRVHPDQAVVDTTAGLLVRIRVEERALFEGLGEPYRRFATGRARLFPGLW